MRRLSLNRTPTTQTASQGPTVHPVESLVIARLPVVFFSPLRILIASDVGIPAWAHVGGGGNDAKAKQVARERAEGEQIGDFIGRLFSLHFYEWKAVTGSSCSSIFSESNTRFFLIIQLCSNIWHELGESRLSVNCSPPNSAPFHTT